MESKIALSQIHNKFKSCLSGYYEDNEIREIFFMVSEHLLNYSKIDTILKANENIPPEKIEKFDEILSKLTNWVPIQYILGYTWFYGLKFIVNKAVLIPRPETEELVDWIIKSNYYKQTKLLDIGTGSGCIAISLALNLANSRISACDISKDALRTAMINADNNKADIDFLEFDITNDQAIPQKKYDIIVSNPPYVRFQEKAMMRKNILSQEPDIALFVPDNDPLLFYKRIALFARKYLLDDGMIYFEINEQFPDEIVKLLKNAGFYGIEVKKDINGKNRMIRGRK